MGYYIKVNPNNQKEIIRGKELAEAMGYKLLDSSKLTRNKSNGYISMLYKNYCDSDGVEDDTYKELFLYKLPDNYFIKCDSDNPLWDKYIKWFNKENNSNYRGNFTDMYYGVRDGEDRNTRQLMDTDCVITLEYWDKIINTKQNKDYIIKGFNSGDHFEKVLENQIFKGYRFPYKCTVETFIQKYNDFNGDIYLHFNYSNKMITRGLLDGLEDNLNTNITDVIEADRSIKYKSNEYINVYTYEEACKAAKYFEDKGFKYFNNYTVHDWDVEFPDSISVYINNVGQIDYTYYICNDLPDGTQVSLYTNEQIEVGDIVKYRTANLNKYKIIEILNNVQCKIKHVNTRREYITDLDRLELVYKKSKFNGLHCNEIIIDEAATVDSLEFAMEGVQGWQSDMAIAMQHSIDSMRDNLINNNNNMTTNNEFTRIQMEKFFNDKKNVSAIEKTLEDLEFYGDLIEQARKKLQGMEYTVLDLIKQMNNALNNNDYKTIEQLLKDNSARIQFLRIFVTNTIIDLKEVEEETNPLDIFNT